MKISTVIPAYNAQNTIARAIDSVLEQSRPADEIIVIDDGSNDATSKVLQKYADRIKPIRQSNAGVSTARNTGIKIASGDWIAFLDADDQWLPDHLKLQCGLLKRNPHLTWTTGNFYRQYKKRKVIDLKERHTETLNQLLNGQEYGHYFKMYLINAVGWTGTRIVKKSALCEAGLFTPGLPRLNDEDMWFRIAYLWPEIGYIQEPSAIYHVDVPGSIIKTQNSASVVKGVLDRHFELSSEQGYLDDFKLCARKIVCHCIGQLLREHKGQDVRILLKAYPALFAGHYRKTTWIKSLCPPLGNVYDQMKHIIKGREQF